MAPKPKKIGFTKTIKKMFKPGGKFSTPTKRKENAKPTDFLLQKERKFPYKFGGKPNARLLQAAIRRAKQTNRPGVARRATTMLNKLKNAKKTRKPLNKTRGKK